MASISGAHQDARPDNPAGDAVANELRLLRSAQDGDRSAYGQLVLAYQDRLYNAMLRMVGDVDEARELTQEAFTRALMKLDSFRGDASPYTWVFRIAVNLAISQLRKAQRRRTFSLDGRVDGNVPDQAQALVDQVADARQASPAQSLERREEAEMVVQALGRLDAEYRAILVMRDVEGFDYQQMAEVLQLPLGTLKSRLFRARLALREEVLRVCPQFAERRNA